MSYMKRLSEQFIHQIDDLTRAMFDDADHDKRGGKYSTLKVMKTIKKIFSAITYEALTNQLTKHGGLLENLSIR